MTQVSLETDISLELLVGELPEIACEHPNYLNDPAGHTAEFPAAYYYKFTCLRCPFGVTRAVCERFVHWLMQPTSSLRCIACQICRKQRLSRIKNRLRGGYLR